MPIAPDDTDRSDGQVPPLAGAWDLDVTADAVRYAHGWKTHLGYAEDGDLDGTHIWRSRVHPEDLVPMLGAQRAHLDGWAARYEVQFRLRDAQGHYRRVWSRGCVSQRDRDGRAVRMVGTIGDISEAGVPSLMAPPPLVQRPLPADLSLQSVLLDSELVGLIHTVHGQVAWANRAACRWLGVGMGAELGAEPGTEGHGIKRLLSERYPQVAQALRSVQSPRRLLLSLPASAGSPQPRWVELSGMPVGGAAGAALWTLVDVTELKAEQARMERLALHDPLTGLPNRLLFGDRLEQALRQSERDGHCVGVAYVDLDGFKAVNDALGHAAGDALLQRIGSGLRESLRPQDTVARLGGDEFVVLLGQLATPDDGLAVLRRLLGDVATTVQLPNGPVQVCASIGVVFHTGAGEMSDLLQQADRAMYRAKRAGGGRIAVHDGGPHRGHGTASA